jgi:ATP-dependent helicase/nuclease subunit B
MYFLARNIDDLGFSSFEEEIARRAEAGDTKSYLYIVPTGAQARELINWVTELSSPNPITLPNILSLEELITRLTRFARPDIRHLSPAESAVFIELALKELLQSNSLEYFEGDHKPSPKLPILRGTFERLVAAIAGLKEHGITPEKIAEDLTKAGSQPERKLADRSSLRKANDVAAIYSLYENKLGDKFTDTEGQYKLLAEYFELPTTVISANQQSKIHQAISSLFPEITDIFVGSFIQIPQPAQTILFALSHLDSIRLTFGLDYGKDNSSLFAIQERFMQQAAKNGFVLVAPSLKSDSVSSQAHTFQHILRESFFKGSERKTDVDFIQTYGAGTMKDEIRFAVKKIKELISRSPDIELSRFCIASYRQDEYAPLAREMFREYGLPANITDRARLDRSPLYLAFNALFDLAEFNFNRRSLQRLLSTPYLNIMGRYGEQIDATNLYEVISEYRLHQGSESWSEEIEVYLEEAQEQLHLALDKYDSDDAEKKLQRLKRANHDIRIIEEFVNRLRGEKTPHEFYRTMLAMMDDCRVVSRILSASGPMITADALEFDTRSYRAFRELLDELLNISSGLGLSNTPLPLSYYTERIRVTALGTRFAPRSEPGRGVIVTSFEQTVGYEFDHVFLVGLNDGIFPEYFSPSIFNLKEHQPDEEEKLIEQRYIFYQALCTFRKSLYLVWHTASDDKKSQIMRSQFVDSLEDIFSVTAVSDDTKTENIFSANEFFRFAPQLSDPPAIAKTNELAEDSLQVLRQNIPRGVSAQGIRRSGPLTEYSGVLPREELSEAEKAKINAFRNHVFSISQLEIYASCPFKFFSKYILRLQPGQRIEIEQGLSGAERGTVLHDTLYHLLTTLRDRKQDIRTISDQDFQSIAGKIMEDEQQASQRSKHHPFVRLDTETVFSPPEPRMGMLQKFIETERKHEHFTTKPRYFEATFGLPIAEGKRDNELYRDGHVEVGGIKLRGKIDRIDMDDSGNYTVIDYKSGKPSAWKDMQEGLSLQLPLYLRIAEDLLKVHWGEKEMTGVAGVYYSLLGKNSKNELAIGLHEFSGKAYEGHGSGSGRTIKAEVESIEELKEAIERTIAFAKTYVDGITEGRFELTKESSIDTACRYCDYKKVCRVGEALDSGALRK